MQAGRNPRPIRRCTAMGSARIGDLFTSLTHTCELNAADPFDYLNQLQRHAEELKHTPSEWMPWKYRATLARTGAFLDAA
jgi:transposase